MPDSRTKNSILNIISTFGGTMAYDLGYFLLRAIFVRCLAEEYLGVEGLFSNILGMLSLMELGIGPAMVVSLYKPLAENDTEKIKSLMGLYRKAYAVIGVCVFAVGAALTPFLNVIIKDVPSSIENIQIIYLLYVANTAISYFCIYKQSVFIADQKNYLVTFWYNLVRIAMLVVQALVLILSKNFILFLVVQIAFTRGANIYISKRADKQYPYLKENNALPIDSSTKKEVFKYAYASSILNIGSKLVNGTDQIIISSCIGLSVGGSYSNYVLVTGALQSIESKILNSCTASIGNLNVVGSDEHFKTVYYRILFIGLSLASFCTVCLAALFQDFVKIWVGEKMLLDNFSVICLLISFYLYSVRFPTQVFNSATGNFYHFKYRAFVEGAINLAVSIIMSKVIGVAGVILGTIISCLVVPFWIEPYIFYRYIFKEKPVAYIRQVLKNFGFTLVVTLLTVYACRFIVLQGILSLLCKGVVAVLIFLASFVTVFHKNENFNYFFTTIKNWFTSMKGKSSL